MNIRLILAILILFFISSFAYTEEAEEFIISEDSVGGIKVGDSVDSIYAIYPEDKVSLENLRGYSEGSFCPCLRIYLGDSEKPSLDVFITWKDKWIIKSIYVLDKRFKTQKGVGSGSTVGDLREKYRLESVHFFAGRLHIGVKSFKASFISQFGGMPVEYLENPNPPLSLAPDDLKIEVVQISIQYKKELSKKE